MRMSHSIALAAAISIGLTNATLAARGGAGAAFLPPRLTPPGLAPAAPGMDNGIGYGVGNMPSPGTVRGANASGAGVGTNPNLQGGLGTGTGVVPKPVGQGF